jgi:hypothetical protein
MTQNEFNHILAGIQGNSLSPEQMRELRDTLDSKLAQAASAGPGGLTAEELEEQAMQRRLVAAGVLSEVKPPPRLLPARKRAAAVPIEGEPLSETVIRERR